MAPSCFASRRSRVWAVWSLILTRAASVTAAPADDVQGGNCSANIRCGKLNISKPFGIVPAEAAEPNCGTFGFQVICKDDTPYLGYYRPNRNIPDYYQLQILYIFYVNRSLLVVDTQKLVDLRNLTHRDCQQYRFPTVNTSSKIAIQEVVRTPPISYLPSCTLQDFRPNSPCHSATTTPSIPNPRPLYAPVPAASAHLLPPS